MKSKIKINKYYLVFEVSPYFILGVLVFMIKFIIPQNFIFFSYITILILFFRGFFKLWYNMTKKYYIDDGMIVFRRGILNKRTDYIELYRVKDLSKYESIFMRIFKVIQLDVITSDKLNPVFKISGADNIFPINEFRNEVEKWRKERRVYEVD